MVCLLFFAHRLFPNDTARDHSRRAGVAGLGRKLRHKGIFLKSSKPGCPGG
jgi:hypothetical protein